MEKLIQKIGQKKYLYLIFLLISILIVAFVNWNPGYAFSTGDYHYHINRIEALAYAIQHFNFLPKVDGYFANGFGYASSLFYPDIFLYPAAILRVIGIPMIVTYWLTQVAINFLTLYFTFIAGKRLGFANKNNLLFTLIYFLSSYRLQVLYSRHDIGELMGMIFFPLVLSELIRFKNGQIKEWYVLTFAMTAIALSHIISLFMIICFAAMFVILNLKYFLKKDKIKNIIKAALLTIGIVFGFYAPIIEQVLNQQLTMETAPLIHIYQEIQPLGQLFHNSLSNQVFHAHSVNLGTVILVGLIVYTIFNLIKRKNLSLTIMALFMFIACTQYFPWYALRNSIFASLQFPWRFFSLISLIVAYFIAQDDLHLFKINYSSGILVIVMLVLSFSLSQLTVQASPWRLNSYQSYDHISSYRIGAGHEYLPSEVDYTAIKSGQKRQLKYDPKQIKISKTNINKDIVQFDFSTKQKSATVELPLFYYKGYQAQTTHGTASKPRLNKSGLTSITLKGHGTVSVNYHYTLTQKLSLIVSIISLVSTIPIIKKIRK